MDEKLRVALSKLFDDYCFILTEKGNIVPTFFLIKDKDIIKVANMNIRKEIYADFVMYQATQQQAEAIVLITENGVVSGSRDDEDIKAIASGKLKIKDHPDYEPHLLLIYISKDGERQGLFGKIEKDPSGVKFIKNHEWASDIFHQMK
jgi:hypothetical protein